MWYAKDELGEIHYKSNNIYKVSQFCTIYNHKKKIAKHRISDIGHWTFSLMDEYDVNKKWNSFVNKEDFPLAIKNYVKKHEIYRKEKLEKLRKIAKKYHCWPYNEKGRKADGFDF